MTFRIRGLDARQFSHLFTLSDAELAAQGAVRKIADGPSPCRVSLTDATPGDEVEDGASDTCIRGLTAVVHHFRRGRAETCAVLCVKDRSASWACRLGFKNLKSGRETVLSDIAIYLCDSRSSQ